MVRLLKYLINTLLLLTGLICLLLVFLYFAPGPLIRPLANTYLNTVGFPIEQVSGAKFTFNESLVADLTISNEQNTFILHGVKLDYRFSQLLRGKVDSLHIDEVELIIGESQAQEASADGSLIEMVEMVKIMPLNTISLGMLNFNDQLQLASLNFTLSPEIFTGALDYQEFSVTGLLNWASSDSLEGNLVIASDTDVLAETNYAITLAEQSLNWQGHSLLSLTQLGKISALEELFAIHQPVNSSIQLASEFTLDDVLAELAIPHYAVTVSSQEKSSLDVDSQFEFGEIHSIIDLPITLSGSAADVTEAIDFELAAFSSEFSWQSESGSSNGNLSVSQLSGNCTVQFDCSSNQQLRMSLDELQLAELTPMSVSFQGEISVAKVNQKIDLMLREQAQATVSGLAYDQLTIGSVNWQTTSSGSVGYDLETNNASMQSAASKIELHDLQSAYALTQLDMEVVDLRIDLEQSLSSSFSFSTDNFVSGLESYVPIDPMLKGDFAFHDNDLALNLNLLVNNQQIISNQISHDLTTGNGSAVIQIPELIFSNITPLSSYFAELPVTAELIAGTIKGQADLAWQMTDQDALQLSGPVDLTINDLGGFYNEIVFVGFQTHIMAQVDSATDIQSSQLLEASLATLDIGTPVANIHWRYQINSAALAATIEDFYAELLGGSISVAAFDYQQQRPQNMLTVELNEVQLTAIAAMAQYPNLFVDGAVSGHVPIIISADSITVNQGVIDAVEPGGVIRYTPTNPAPNPNSTMQLVNDALSNYHYKSLDSEVTYDENGDLILAVKMRGANPDLNAGQEINLNLNITDNIPTLLRSLQAGRVITDTLERTIQERQNSRSIRQ